MGKLLADAKLAVQLPANMQYPEQSSGPDLWLCFLTKETDVLRGQASGVRPQVEPICVF